MAASLSLCKFMLAIRASESCWLTSSGIPKSLKVQQGNKRLDTFSDDKQWDSKHKADHRIPKLLFTYNVNRRAFE